MVKLMSRDFASRVLPTLLQDNRFRAERSSKRKATEQRNTEKRLVMEFGSAVQSLRATARTEDEFVSGYENIKSDFASRGLTPEALQLGRKLLDSHISGLRGTQDRARTSLLNERSDIAEAQKQTNLKTLGQIGNLKNQPTLLDDSGRGPGAAREDLTSLLDYQGQQELLGTERATKTFDVDQRVKEARITNLTTPKVKKFTPELKSQNVFEKVLEDELSKFTELDGTFTDSEGEQISPDAMSSIRDTAEEKARRISNHMNTNKSSFLDSKKAVGAEMATEFKQDTETAFSELQKKYDPTKPIKDQPEVSAYIAYLVENHPKIAVDVKARLKETPKPKQEPKPTIEPEPTATEKVRRKQIQKTKAFKQAQKKPEKKVIPNLKKEAIEKIKKITGGKAFGFQRAVIIDNPGKKRLDSMMKEMDEQGVPFEITANPNNNKVVIKYKEK